MRGRALIIATSDYSDTKLSALQSTQIDAEGLQETLSDVHIGDFGVGECLNAPCQTWREQIEEFFAEASYEESLLLYISGHAIKDRDGKLYFAASDTRLNRLIATGIPSAFIQEVSNSSRSKRITMVFDTCFSGAFAKGIPIKTDWQTLDAGGYFNEGSGKVIITASDALQYALAGDSIGSAAEVGPSIFSKHLIDGLRTGEADTDRDGQITTEDLYRYVSESLHRDGAKQRPQRWSFGVTNDFVIAASAASRPGKLPDTIIELISDGSSAGRLLAVKKLSRLLKSVNVPSVLAARCALNNLQTDGSPAVASAAGAALFFDTEYAKANTSRAQCAPRIQLEQLPLEREVEEFDTSLSTQPNERTFRRIARIAGQVLVYVVLFCPFLFGVLVLAIPVGSLFIVLYIVLTCIFGRKRAARMFGVGRKDA